MEFMTFGISSFLQKINFLHFPDILRWTYLDWKTEKNRKITIENPNPREEE